MSMSKKDFEAIAHILLVNAANAEVRSGSTPVRERLGQVAVDLGRYFAQANPRFDSDRFLRAALMVSNPQHPSYPASREAPPSLACECGAPWDEETGGYTCAN